MELMTEKALGKEKVRVAAYSLLRDIQHGLNTSANSYWEFLRYGHKKQFEAYNKKNSDERLEVIIKEDYQCMRNAIMADAIRLYIARLEEGNGSNESH